MTDQALALPPYSVRDVRLAPGETRFVDGWLLVRSRRHLFIASPPPLLRLWAQANTCRRVSIDPKHLWDGKGFVEAAAVQPPRELGHWRVDGMPDGGVPAEIDELKYKLDGCRHILRQAGYPAIAPLLGPLGVFGFALLELTTREPGFADLIAQNPALAVAFAWLRPSMGSAASKPGSWKQRDLAGELGFRPEAARILARIVPSAITLERLDLVRRLPLEARTGLQGLQQAKSINAITFALLGEPEWQAGLSDRVIQEVGEIRADKADAFSWLLGSVLKTLKHENRALPRIRSYRDLARLLSLAFPLAVHIGPVAAPAEAPVVAPKERRKRCFPAPFPGGEGIEPLDTVEEILEEGRLQRNCIGLGHVRRVSHGGADP